MEIVDILRELAKISQGRNILLPIEIVDIMEGKQIEENWKNIEISKVMNYLASMLEK